MIVHVANFANWSATRDGTPLTIRSASLGDWDGFIGVAGGDGTVVVRYAMTAADWGGALLSLFAVLVVCALLFARRLPASTAPVTAPIRGIVELLERKAKWLVGGLILARCFTSARPWPVCHRRRGGPSSASLIGPRPRLPPSRRRALSSRER